MTEHHESQPFEVFLAFDRHRQLLAEADRQRLVRDLKHRGRRRFRRSA